MIYTINHYIYLGNYIPYEIVIGMNGYVWINTHHMKNLITIRNILLNSEYLLLQPLPILSNTSSNSSNGLEVEKWKHINILVKCMLDKILPQYDIV